MADLEATIEGLAHAPDEAFHQGDAVGAPVDFFAPAVAAERRHPNFRLLSEAERFGPAKAAISAMMRYHEDVDGNFVQLFQSTGFDARLWELYLFAAITELEYARVGELQAPDFLLSSPFGSLAIEATTSNPPHRMAVPMRHHRDGFIDYLHNYIPIKLAKALNRKLRHDPPYWSRPEVRDIPLVLAVQDFHRAGAMRMVVPAATEFVFGVRHWPTDDGIRVERLTEHRYDGLVEPSGFFGFEGAENVSAVLLNPQGTITKFNRMGYLAGFGDRAIRMVKSGVARGERDQGNPGPKDFRLEVRAPGYSESWVEGMVVLHNPNARIPLDPAMIQGAAHEFLREDGRIMSLLPEFHPLFSETIIEVPGEASLLQAEVQD